MNTKNPLIGQFVQDEDGNKVALQDLWRDGPVVLVFVRHFG